MVLTIILRCCHCATWRRCKRPDEACRDLQYPNPVRCIGSSNPVTVRHRNSATAATAASRLAALTLTLRYTTAPSNWPLASVLAQQQDPSLCGSATLKEAYPSDVTLSALSYLFGTMCTATGRHIHSTQPGCLSTTPSTARLHPLFRRCSVAWKQTAASTGDGLLL